MRLEEKRFSYREERSLWKKEGLCNPYQLESFIRWVFIPIPCANLVIITLIPLVVVVWSVNLGSSPSIDTDTDIGTEAKGPGASSWTTISTENVAKT